MYVSSVTAQKILGVTSNTLRSWDKKNLIKTIRTPTNYRLYDVETFQSQCESKTKEKKENQVGEGSSNLQHVTNKTGNKQKFIYARVSSQKQKADLQRQIESLQEKYPEHKVVYDIASGINFQRKGLQKLLQLSSQGMVEQIVCAHRDRLCRFAFELLEYIFRLHETQLVVHCKEENKNLACELSEDLLAINTVFICRMQGRRAAENRKRRTQFDNKQDSSLL